MNPIESYRDPSLDRLLEPSVPPPPRKTSRHSRQTSMTTREAFPPPQLLAAPEVPRVPPVAYSGNNPNGQGLQRSFSQRARTQPYAAEAFADDDLADTAKDPLLQRHHQSRQAPVSEPKPQSSTEPENHPTARRQKMIQDNLRSAANQVRSPRDSAEIGVPKRSLPYEEVETNLPGFTKAATLKDVTNSNDQREWASDRSPLQKLEVKLNDISKEEKRARVREAEMLHREKARSQKPSTRSADPRVTVPPVTQPHTATVEDVGMVHGLGDTHKDRLQHNTTMESRKPDVTRPSSNRQGFEHHSAAFPTQSVTITRRGNRASTGPSVPISQRSLSSSQAQPISEPYTNVSQNRSVSAAQPNARQLPLPLPPDSSDPQTSQRKRPRQIYDSDRIPTAQERNASHRAALEQLTGTMPAPAKPSTNTRDSTASKLQDPARTRAAQLSQNAARTVTPQGQPIPFNSGLQDSPGLRSIDSPAPAEGPVHPVQRQKRQSSVSFKEPYERRRPVDEWKAAELAQLTADDFVLEPKPDPDRHKAWWEEDPQSRQRASTARAATATENLAVDDRMAEFKPRLLLKCGPLLRYTGMKRTVGVGAKEYWRGTVMMVTQDSQSSYEKPPTLRLFAQPKSLYTHSPPPPPVDGEEPTHEDVDPLSGSIKVSRIGRALYVRPVQNLPPGKDLSHVETDDGLYESSPPMTNAEGQSVSVTPVASRLAAENGEKHGRFKEIKGVRLYADPDRDVTFWLFKLEVQLGLEQQHIGYRINNGAASGFWVPAEGQTMHIMFHSCNGFSLAVKSDEFTGPDPMWRDVLNAHQSRPFHVMLGGGDQIYNDKATVQTQYFGDWTMNRNPHYKHHAPFTPEMKEELESFYLENYSQWFSQGLFSMANSQIPMVNMWDDHDIIDGFGSYPHAFMSSPVFSGIGNVAFKYYMLFQQHSVEAMTSTDEPSWVLGYKPGPYIKQVSRSIFMDLGRPVSFLALDCRTERTKTQVLSLDTADIALERCRREIVEGQTKHLIVLLGVPIAYPRMNWLENVLTSRAMDPVKALGRYGVLKGGFLNKFDGGVEILDDLDDHWTAHYHKEERNELIKELQDLAAERSVRVTILGGDVHLAAIGQFYSNPKLKIPKDRDHRYMPNVVSSAIVNTPPPDMLADVLNKRNKVHHLDSYTDESMIPMFTHDVDLKRRNNKHLLPRRNWCSITQYLPGRTPPSSRGSSPTRSELSLPAEDQDIAQPKRRFSLSRDDVNPRTLFRRLSSRNAPPTAYRDGGVHAEEQGQRAASFDDVRADRSQNRNWNEMLGFTRRAASETRQPVRNETDTSLDQFNPREPPPFRPGFHRRPTNLSEKAAKKGNVPAVDADGNEFEVNDHINLDGGLDIVLNCEVDRNDPRGTTEPYRLLVPSLWYDGSSDREKLDSAGGIHRKPTLINKLGFGNRRGNKPGHNQEDDWEQETSETGSYSASEGEPEPLPKKKFDLLGSLRRKRPERDIDTNREIPDQFGGGTGVASVPADTTTTPNGTPPRMRQQAGPLAYDMTHDVTSDPQQPSKASFNRPPPQAREMDAAPQRSSSFKAKTLLQKSNSKRQAVSTDAQPPLTYSDHGPTATQYQPQSAQSPPEPISLATARRNSYTIGTFGSNGSQRQTSRAPVDADSAYLSSQNRTSGRYASNTIPTASGPPSSYPFPVTETGRISRDASLRSNPSHPNKQDRVLGIGAGADDFSGNPQQRVLRGNGILGKLGIGGGHSASADQVGQHSGAHTTQAQPLDKQDNSFPGPPQRTMSQGYSGIDAYREKPRRGVSLRDRARNLMGKFEGRRRYDDDDDDSYSYSDDAYSDDLGEAPEHSHDHIGHDQMHDQRQYYSDDDAGSFIGGDNGANQPPKRGLSQKFRLGMMRMASGGAKRSANTGRENAGVAGGREGKSH